MCLFCDCDTVMTAVSIFWLFTYYVCFVHASCKYNESWCDCHTVEKFSAINPGSIHHFQSPNACTKSGIWQLLSFRLMCFIIWFCYLIRDFPFEFSSKFSIFVTLILKLRYPIVVLIYRRTCIEKSVRSEQILPCAALSAYTGPEVLRRRNVCFKICNK